MAPPDRLADLSEINAALWRELGRAPLDRHHEWRSPVLATVAGDRADARTVVLRETDADARELRLFTDARAGKVQQIAQHPHGTLAMWSRRLKWQLRVQVLLTVQSEGLGVASRWAKLKNSPAAQDYLNPLPPGSVLDTTAPGREVPERGHFAIVVCSVVAIDWLELHAEGHRRAAFDAAGGRWLVP